MRTPAITFKRFENLVEKLKHSAIDLPAGKGLCASLNRAIAIKPKMVTMGDKGAVCAAFKDWLQLLRNMRSRPTHVNELVLQTISDVGNMDASGIGAGGGGGAWMSLPGAYDNVVWRVEWPADAYRQVISNSNPKGTITNSDLEMTAIILAWLVLEQTAPTHHHSALARSDNTPACSWATRMSPKFGDSGTPSPSACSVPTHLPGSTHDHDACCW